MDETLEDTTSQLHLKRSASASPDPPVCSTSTYNGKNEDVVPSDPLHTRDTVRQRRILSNGPPDSRNRTGDKELRRETSRYHSHQKKWGPYTETNHRDRSPGNSGMYADREIQRIRKWPQRPNYNDDFHDNYRHNQSSYQRTQQFPLRHIPPYGTNRQYFIPDGHYNIPPPVCTPHPSFDRISQRGFNGGPQLYMDNVEQQQQVSRRHINNDFDLSETSHLQHMSDGLHRDIRIPHSDIQQLSYPLPLNEGIHIRDIGHGIPEIIPTPLGQPVIYKGGINRFNDPISQLPLRGDSLVPRGFAPGRQRSSNLSEFGTTILKSDGVGIFQGKLNKSLILEQFVHLGDTMVKLSDRILFIATESSQSIVMSEPRLDILLLSSDFTLNQNLHHTITAHNMDVLCDSILNCVSHFPVKASIYATLVALWSIQKTKLTEGITVKDFESLHMKPDPAGPPLPSRDHLETMYLTYWLMNCLTKQIVSGSVEKLNEFLSFGRITEAKNILRFLIELTNCEIISPIDLFQVIEHLLTIAIEFDISHGIFTECLFTIVLSCIPWITRKIADQSLSHINKCLNLIDTFIQDRRQHLNYLHALRPIWGDTIQINDSLTEGLQACKDLRDYATWSSKCVLRVYNSSFFVNILTLHNAVVIHNLPSLTITAEIFKNALIRNRAAALEISLMGFSNQVDPATTTNLEVKDVSYDIAVIEEYGVGGGTLGQNGCWESRFIFRVWDDTALATQLCDIKPLGTHDRWVLSELFLSVLHSFRHTIDLCAEALLRIPIPHKQFELILVEVIFNEMLRLPRSAEIPLFYFRLLHLMSQKETNLLSIIASAIYSIVRQCHHWDTQTLETFSDFLGFWFSSLGDHLDQFDFSQWSPEGIRKDWDLWERLGHHLDLPSNHIIILTDEEESYKHQRLPYSLKELLCKTMERAACLLWSGTLRAKLPSWLHFYIPADPIVTCTMIQKYEEYLQHHFPNSETNTTQSITHSNELSSIPIDILPLEYIIFRRLIQTRFIDDSHRTNNIKHLSIIIFSKLLGRPALCKLPSEQFFYHILCPKTDLYQPTHHSKIQEDYNGKKEISPDNIAAVQTKPVDELSNLLLNENHDELPLSVIKCETMHTDIEGIEEPETELSLYVKNEAMVTNDTIESTEFGSIHNVKLPEQGDIKLFNEIPSVDNIQTDSVEDNYNAALSEQFLYADNGHHWELLPLAQLFIRALLGQAAKTLTHCSRIFNNYKDILLWMRPSSSKEEFIIRNEKDADCFIYTSNDNNHSDADYFAALLHVVFSFWTNGYAIKHRFLLDTLTRLEIIPLHEVQHFILRHLPLKYLGSLACYETLFDIIRKTAKNVMYLKKNIKVQQRMALGGSIEAGNNAIVKAEELFSLSMQELSNLVLEFIVESCRRIQQLSVANKVSQEDNTILLDDRSFDPSLDFHAPDVQFIAESQKHEDENLRRILFYARYFLHFFDSEAMYSQVIQIGKPTEKIMDLMRVLHGLQSLLYPDGVATLDLLLPDRPMTKLENLNDESTIVKCDTLEDVREVF